MAFTQNFPKWHTSLMKAYYGDAATKDNDFAYDWFPKRDGAYDVLAIFERMHQGKMNGFIVQGFNPLAAVPNKKLSSAALAKLKYLVVMDPLETETSEFWKNHGPLNDVEPEDQDRGVPPAHQLLCRGDRQLHQFQPVISWKEKAVDPRASQGGLGDHRPPVREAEGGLREGRRRAARTGGRADLAYLNANVPQSAELLRRSTALADVALADVLAPPDPKAVAPRRQAVLVKAGDRCPASRCCATTGPPPAATGSTAASGAPGGQPVGGAARHRRPHRAGRVPQLGLQLAGQPAHPLQPRQCRRTASPGIRAASTWPGTVSWAGGADVPDMRPRRAPDQGAGAFIMNPEGVARSARGGHERRPFPEHYEPFETPVGVNLMCPTNPKAVSNPPRPRLQGRPGAFGKKEEFPYAATTYPPDRAPALLDQARAATPIVQPAFVEIGEDLAKEKGIRQGDKVKVRSNRGEVVAACVVTKRIKGARRQRQEGAPRGHPHPLGLQGRDAERLPGQCADPFVGDANSQTPEFKAFLVNIEKDRSPAPCQSAIAKTWWPARPPPGRRRRCAPAAPQVAKLIDESKCIGCKACQVACMNWNDLRDEVGQNIGVYDNPSRPDAPSWTVMRFFEVEPQQGNLEWLIRKDGCMHCEDPGCLKACPAPGAIVKYANGIVDFVSENCIGCGYCVKGCPFDVPRISAKDNKAYKCTLCSDRVGWAWSRRA